VITQTAINAILLIQQSVQHVQHICFFNWLIIHVNALVDIFKQVIFVSPVVMEVQVVLTVLIMMELMDL